MGNLIQRIMEDFGLSEGETLTLVRSAPYRYKVYQIPKRQAGKFRTIAQPAREVKTLQRWLVSKALADLPVHNCAMAYRKGRGIKHNVLPHVSNRYLLKMDFRDFFPSIKARDLTAHIQRHLARRFTPEECELIGRIALWKPKGNSELILSIGGPSSPFISNSIIFDFDELVFEYCRGKDVTYTRYADDLAFSTNLPNVLVEVEGFVSSVCKQLDYPDLSINREKTVFASKKHRRKLTGLILSNQERVSLGRDRKRIIRAMVHRFVQGNSTPDELDKLRGLVAFSLDVEPHFVNRLRNKYGGHQIDRILNSRTEE